MSIQSARDVRMRIYSMQQIQIFEMLNVQQHTKKNEENGCCFVIVMRVFRKCMYEF